MKNYNVYILQCNDDSYYTGVTNNIEKRFYEHQNGLIENCYTHSRRPLKLAGIENFQDINRAIEREKQIKGWKRIKKEALIKKLYKDLPKLSLRYTPNKNKEKGGRPSRASG